MTQVQKPATTKFNMKNPIVHCLQAVMPYLHINFSVNRSNIGSTSYTRNHTRKKKKKSRLFAFFSKKKRSELGFSTLENNRRKGMLSFTAMHMKSEEIQKLEDV